MVKRKIDKINNKRPVKDDTVKDRLLREQQSYYDRLYYQCQKDLNKQVKVAKTFEIQKLIRKIKELNENINNTKDDNDDDKQNKNNKQNSNNSIEKLERKLNEIKRLDTLEPIIQECFRRLGIIQINPSYLITQQQNNVSDDTTEVVTSNEHDDTLTIDIHANKDQLSSENSSEMIDNNNSCNDTISSQTNLSNAEVNDEQSKTHNSSSTSLETVSASSWLYERILQHKKIQVAIEKWNDQITEYRRWCLRQEERFIDGIRTNNTNDKKNNKKSKKDDTNKRNNSNNNKPSHQQDDEEENDNTLSNSMFVKFGNNDNVDDTGSNNINYYGPEGEEPKKNRSGQRARRAKAIAIQAKKDGTIIDKSINWRQPKQQQNQLDQSTNSTDHSSSNHQKVNTNKKQETLHPSWEARKSNQKGIVEFQGKKITF